MAGRDAEQEIIKPGGEQGVPTRGHAIESIKNVKNLEELFDVANKALGSWRQSWGDDLGQSAAAAKAWGACSFPAHAAETVRFTNSFTRSVSGTDYCKAGLEAAKAAAIELLTPLPAPALGGGQDGLDEALLRVRRVAFEASSTLAENGSTTWSAVFKRKLDGAALLGPYGLQKMECSAQELRADSQGEARSWQALDKHLSGTQNASPSGAIGRQGADPFRALVDEAGFEIVNVGPLGGMTNAIEGASQILAACRDLAFEIKAPSVRVAGLGGLGVYANCDQGEADASFVDTSFALSFGANPAALGHEWSHAFEALIKKQSSEIPMVRDATEALGQLEALIQNGLTIDEGCMRDACDSLTQKSRLSATRSLDRFIAASGAEPWAGDPAVRAQATRELVDYLHEVGLKDARQWVDHQGGPHAVSAGPRLVPGASWLPESRERGPAEFTDKLIKLTGSDPLQIDSQSVAAHFDAAREAGRKQAILEACAVGSNSSFEACAKAMVIFSGLGKEGYWTEGKEMLARAAEGFYLQGSSRAALVNDPQGVIGVLSVPHGAEREALGKAYGQWMKASMPWLGNTCGFEIPPPEPVEAARQGSVAEPQKKKEDSALAAFGHVVAWAKDCALDAVAVGVALGARFSSKLMARRASGSEPALPEISSKAQTPGR